MQGRPPRACRFLIAAAGHIVPRSSRAAWRTRWDREVWNWWAFLAEHGAFDRRARADLVGHCWTAFPDALGTRFQLAPRLARLFRTPQFCLMAAALPLVVMAVLSHGFSGVRAVSTPLPWHDADRVVVFAFDTPLRLEMFAPATLTAWKEAVRLEDLAPFQFREARLDGRRVREARVGPNFFHLLGVRAAAGGLLEPEDQGAAVLSYEAWKRLPPGGTVMLDGARVRVAGVLPPDFWFFHRDVAVWRLLPPLAPHARVGAVARLKSFAGEHDAERELTLISHELPGRAGMWVQLLPIAERLRSAGRWCSGVALGALLAACILALIAFRHSRRCGLLMVANATLLIAGLALVAIELPAAVYGAGTAGRGLLVEPGFLLTSAGVVWWTWRDGRRRCRRCLRRLSLPVHFGNFGSPLLESNGIEFVCECGHGSLYVPGMHWSASEPERWTELDNSWTDLFRSN